MMDTEYYVLIIIKERKIIMNGGERIAQVLKQEGVEFVFTVCSARNRQPFLRRTRYPV